MSHAKRGRLELRHYGWGQHHFERTDVERIPNNYQKYFTKLLYLEFTWVHSYYSEACDFRTFSMTWRSLDYNEYFPISICSLHQMGMKIPGRDVLETKERETWCPNECKAIMRDI